MLSLPGNHPTKVIQSTSTLIHLSMRTRRSKSTVLSLWRRKLPQTHWASCSWLAARTSCRISRHPLRNSLSSSITTMRGFGRARCLRYSNTSMPSTSSPNPKPGSQVYPSYVSVSGLQVERTDSKLNLQAVPLHDKVKELVGMIMQPMFAMWETEDDK
jgi:hypothetical protein